MGILWEESLNCGLGAETYGEDGVWRELVGTKMSQGDKKEEALH